MTVEQKLDDWLQQPGAFVTQDERQFIADMRKARSAGVGYGWMQQIIEWEWQSTGVGAWGPEHFQRRIQELEQKLQAALRWAVTEGANGRITASGKLELRDAGCGCCSGKLDPPEELREVIIEALQPADQVTERHD